MADLTLGWAPDSLTRTGPAFNAVVLKLGSEPDYKGLYLVPQELGRR